jgi:hypothetical protein
MGHRFGDSIELVGYDLDRTRVSPSERLSLHLYWRAHEAPKADYWSLIELVDDYGTFLMYKDGSPSAGRDTTDRWVPGAVIVSEHRLLIPDIDTPGEYHLTLRLHPVGERTWLPVTHPEWKSAKDTLILDQSIQINLP